MLTAPIICDITDDISSKQLLIAHVTKIHSSHFHLANMQICQAIDLHVCPQCDCAVNTSVNKLEQHHHAKHHDSRTISNLVLCLKPIQAEVPSNYNLIWDEGLQFIHGNIGPDRANFQSGVCEKVGKGWQEQFDEIFMGIIYACINTGE